MANIHTQMLLSLEGINFTILKMAGPIELLRLSEQMGLTVLMNPCMCLSSATSCTVATAAQVMPCGSFANGLKWDGFIAKDH